MSRAGQLWCTVLLGAVLTGGPAVAEKLGKEACASLAGELTALNASGLKADMERGAAWGLANMDPERLQSVRRLMELEDQLEFRCGARGIGKQREAPPAAPAAPAADTRTAGRPPAGPPPPASQQPPTSPQPPAAAQAPVYDDGEEGPLQAPKGAPAAENPVPAGKTPSERAAPATALPAPRTLAPVHNTPAAPHASGALGADAARVTKALPPVAAPAPTGPAPSKPVAVASPPPTSPVTASTAPAVAPAAATAAPAVPATASTNASTVPSPAGVPITRLGPLPSAAGVVAAVPAPGAVVPGGKKPADPAAQKKNPRRVPSQAYVSPGEVSPFALPGLR